MPVTDQDTTDKILKSPDYRPRRNFSGTFSGIACERAFGPVEIKSTFVIFLMFLESLARDISHYISYFSNIEDWIHERYCFKCKHEPIEKDIYIEQTNFPGIGDIKND